MTNGAGWFRINGKLVGKITKELSDVSDASAFPKALDVIAKQVRNLVGAHQSAVSYIPDSNFTQGIHITSLSDKYAKYRTYDILPTGKGIWALIFETGKPMRLTEKELYSHPRFKHFSNLKTSSGLEHPPMPGWVAVPIKRMNGEPVGVLQLSDKYEGDFTAEDEAILENFSTLIGASFELKYIQRKLHINKHERRSLEERVLEFELLNGWTELVLESLSIEEAMKKCLEFLCMTIRWPVGHIYIPKKDRTALITSNIWYVDNKVKASKFMQTTEDYEFKKGIGLPGRIWESGKPAWIEDVYKDDNFPRAKVCKDINVHGAVGFPVQIGGEVVAVFEFFSYAKERKKETLLTSFNLIGEKVGYLFGKQLMEDKLDHIAHHDALTGLPNRYYFQEMLNQTISRCLRQHITFSLLFIDVDGFKHINDSYGHSIGDLFLKEIGNRLSSSVRDSDYVSRYGGDEFIILLESVKPSSLTAFIEKLLSFVEKPVFINKVEMKPSISIGIASYPDNGLTGDELLKRSDAAMYFAKETKIQKYMLYNSSLHNKIKEKHDIENHLKAAIKNNEFSLVYQPIIDSSARCIHAFETLLRWKNKILGEVSPAIFIPIAEEIGIIDDVTCWVFKTALTEFHHGRETKDVHTLSINVSAKNLLDEKCIEFMSSVLKDLNIDTSKVILEITETELMLNPQVVEALLGHLSQIGVLIAVDDFGIGYSSLAYLKKFPVTYLKIDKTFVDGCCTDGDDLAIIKATIHMAHSLGLQVIAEGVEKLEQEAILVEENCDFLQGYLYSTPKKFKDIMKFELNWMKRHTES